MRDSAAELERLVDSRTAELRRLSGRLMTMQDEERRRIAREIHDGLGQELAAAKMILDGILAKDKSPSLQQASVEASQLVDRAIQQVRTISHLLHPPLLDEVGLVSALRWFLEGLSQRSGIEIQLQVQPKSLGRLKSEVETAIFRIVQEALTNMFRHSGAQHGCIAVSAENGNVVVTVSDDGKGGWHWRYAPARHRTGRHFAAGECESRDHCAGCDSCGQGPRIYPRSSFGIDLSS
jgi:signal transduction histidine kinase